MILHCEKYERQGSKTGRSRNNKGPRRDTEKNVQPGLRWNQAYDFLSGILYPRRRITSTHPPRVGGDLLRCEGQGNRLPRRRKETPPRRPGHSDLHPVRGDSWGREHGRGQTRHMLLRSTWEGKINNTIATDTRAGIYSTLVESLWNVSPCARSHILSTFSTLYTMVSAP